MLLFRKRTHELSEIDIIRGAKGEVGSFTVEAPLSDGVGMP